MGFSDRFGVLAQPGGKFGFVDFARGKQGDGLYNLHFRRLDCNPFSAKNT